MNPWPLRIALVAAAVLAVAVDASKGRAQDNGLPQGPGRQEVVDGCTSCHEAGQFTSERHNAAEWQGVVDEMIGMGATISQDQSKLIVTYLAQNYPADPNAPPKAATPPAPAPAQ